jgi:TPR repeat protein
MKKSAELGYALAQNTLGFMYLNGECCEKNVDESIKYFEASLADFDSSSMTLAAMYNDGNGVEQDFAKALYYYKVASALGNADAMLKVGIMTLKGVGCEADQEKALSYIIKSAKNGNESAIQIVNALTNEEN